MRAASFVFNFALAEDLPAAPADQQTVTTVMVVFSQDKWRSYGGTRAGALNVANQIITQWNTARTNNHDPSVPDILPMELGGIMLTSYTTGQAVKGDSMLGWMTTKSILTPGAGYEEVFGELTRIGADEVLSISGTDACGLAYVCASAAYPFASVEAGCAVGNMSGIHEMGHNWCGNHEPQTACNAANCSTGDYGYGWGGPLLSEVACTTSNCTGHSVERDPLTYPREGGNRVLYWSSPLKTRTINGTVYAIGRVGKNDNAGALRRQGPFTANFRVTTGAGPLPIPGVSTTLKVTVH
jgi:hypothetical protein